MSEVHLYEQYQHERNLSNVETTLYAEILHQYAFDAQDSRKDLTSDTNSSPSDSTATAAPLYFPHEPCEHIPSLHSKMKQAQASIASPHYLICCYAAYPLTDKLNALLYMHKQMKSHKTTPLSFSDSGNLSPLIALHFAEKVQQNIWMICMEQITTTEPSYFPQAYPKADALSLLQFTPNVGDGAAWQVLYYGLEQWDHTTLCEIRNEPSTLFTHTSSFITDMLAKGNLEKQQVTIIPQTLSPVFTSDLTSLYPHVYTTSASINRGTADPLYHLATLPLPDLPTDSNILLLLFVDEHFGVGGMMLRRVND
ncbi:hypothetical protein [Longirhabdus pacifica]|uniref:hypothetical protein n=1 Tax=Longirhabdus pacifica TaxID=2305227 RepID=UPI0010087756|nr:hypothetical protein [Longirhabdus pacifica]